MNKKEQFDYGAEYWSVFDDSSFSPCPWDFWTEDIVQNVRDNKLADKQSIKLRIGDVLGNPWHLTNAITDYRDDKELIIRLSLGLFFAEHPNKTYSAEDLVDFENLRDNQVSSMTKRCEWLAKHQKIVKVKGKPTKWKWRE